MTEGYTDIDEIARRFTEFAKIAQYSLASVSQSVSGSTNQ